jgi:hypothetical protein
VTEVVRLRTSYRYASVRARDQAVAAALGVLSASSTMRCEFTLGAVVTVDVAIPLFSDHDYAVFAMLERGSIASSMTTL